MESKFIKCDCGGEVLEIEHDDGLFYITIYQFYPPKSGTFQRILYALKYIITGKVTTNNIVISKESAKELSQFIWKMKE